MSLITCALCAAIALRLLFYRRAPGARHRHSMSFLAWLIVIVCAIVVVRIASGYHESTDPFVIILVGVFCAAVFSAEGNIARLCGVRPPKRSETELHA